MKLAKANIVTILIAVMLAVIDTGLYQLFKPGFIAITGAFAVFGYLYAALNLRNWMLKDDAPHMRTVSRPEGAKTPKTAKPKKEEMAG